MKIPIFLALLGFCLSSLVAAWTKEDHEIFRLREEIEHYEGEGVTFYDFVGVKPSVNRVELDKAYKKKSVKLHPDKFRPIPPPSQPGKPPRKLSSRAIAEQRKLATERYARLGIVINILRGPERERYDHFLKNGFPKWKGTGYYYARYRPGLGTVLIGLFIFGGGLVHYGILAVTAHQQRKFLQVYIDNARKSAWGTNGVPGLPDVASATPVPPSNTVAETNGPVNRRQRREMKKQKKGGRPEDDEDVPIKSASPLGAAGPGRRKVMAPNGKVLIVDSAGNVFLVEKDEDTGEEIELPLDLNEIEGPKWSNTFMFKLPKLAFAKTIGRLLPHKEDKQEDYEEDDAGTTSEQTAEDEEIVKDKKPGVASKVERAGGLPRRKVKTKRG